MKDYLSKVGEDKVVAIFLSDNLLEIRALNAKFSPLVLEIEKGNLVNSEIAKNLTFSANVPQERLRVFNGKPSEQLFVSCKADSLVIQDLVSGEEIQRLLVDNLLSAQAFQSLHGDEIIVFEDNQVRVWQLKTHKEWLEAK